MSHASAEAGAEPAAADPERAWIRQIAGGDRGAFDRLFRAYHVRVFRYLFRMVGSAESAEELANDVMVAVWESARRFRAESKASTWIFGIAHHKALNALRRRRPAEVEVEAARELPHPGDDPEARLAREGYAERVRRALQGLSPEHREVVQLAFFQGLSYAEIAAIARCPVNTVKTRMFHARRRLQRVLHEMGPRSETA